MRSLYLALLLWASLCLSNLCASTSELSTPSQFCFSEINEQELTQDWTKEYTIALAFASQKDYQTAINCFKRALILCPKSSLRSKEIEYATVLSYYLDQQYSNAIKFFETHSLLYIDQQFPAYHDLMIILHHSYEALKQSKKADIILERISDLSKKEALSAALTGAILRKDFKTVEEVSTKLGQSEWIMKLTHNLIGRQKSHTVARWLNVFLPGMGYFYLGQKKAALCAFMLNGLLIWGSVQLFLSHYYTLGALTAIFEIGWYAGGIVGAKEATTLLNETLFANYAEKILFQDDIAPKNKLRYEF